MIVPKILLDHILVRFAHGAAHQLNKPGEIEGAQYAEIEYLVDDATGAVLGQTNNPHNGLAKPLDLDKVGEVLGAQFAIVAAQLAETQKQLAELTASAKTAADAAAEAATTAAGDIAARDAAIAQRDAVIAERDAGIVQLNAAVAQLNTGIGQRDLVIAERDAAIAQLNTAHRDVTARAAAAVAALTQA